LGSGASFGVVDATGIRVFCGGSDAGVARSRQYICMGDRRDGGVSADIVALHTGRPVLQPAAGITAESGSLSDGSDAKLPSEKPL